jgi:hypothetical protein
VLVIISSGFFAPLRFVNHEAAGFAFFKAVVVEKIIDSVENTKSATTRNALDPGPGRSISQEKVSEHVVTIMKTLIAMGSVCNLDLFYIHISSVFAPPGALHESIIPPPGNEVDRKTLFCLKIRAGTYCIYGHALQLFNYRNSYAARREWEK